MPESQLTKLRGVVCQIRFKTDLLSQKLLQSSKKIVFWILPFYGFLHLRQQHTELCRARRCPALSVLGGEADFVIVAHHRGSPAILNC